MTKMTAYSILEIDSQIEWLIGLDGDFSNEIEILKQQKIDIYDSSN